MAIAKREFPPLLPPGFHPMTLMDVHGLCVAPFKLSTTRATIMLGLEAVVDRLRRDGVEGELWVDGSFLTEKIEPEDVDVVMVVSSDHLSTATAQQLYAVDWLKSDLKPSHRCDSYVLVAYPLGHSLAGYGEWMRAYWIKQFGFSRGDEFKGMPVVKVP